MKKIYTLILTLVAVVMLSACQQGGVDKCPCSKPTVIINDVTENSAHINFEHENLDTAMYLCVPKSDGTPSKEMILKDGIKLEESSFTLSGLDSETEYVFALYVTCLHGTEYTEYKEFITLKDDAVVLQDGFMAYDGFDSASGRFRLNIMMCSESMSGNDGTYEDILIYVYLKNELESIDNKTRKVPFGKITPFYTDGSSLGDMVYYIGRHKSDADGANAEGTSVFYYSENVNSEIIVADDTDNSEFEIIDNGDGTYTVRGIVVDKTKGKSYKFKYTDRKPVYSIDQTRL